MKNSPKDNKNLSTDWRSLISTYSPYLSESLNLYPNPLSFEKTIEEGKKQLLKATSTADVMSTLRQLKKKVSLFIAIQDLKKEWSDIEVMEKLSLFADFCINEALKHLLERAYKDKEISSPHLKDSGLTIIALGKWGAYELNYSSDIDLMVIFDTEKSPLLKKEKTQLFFNRLARNLAELLETLTADGYVFRTDLRLRPDPGAMPLAISFASAETYYSNFGQNWERAAMIKARPVAGDPQVSKDFMQLMTSWIWRKNLDFAAIQDIHSIKRQINTQQRKGRKKNSLTIGKGFNVKLGHGGIREIEFFVQTQQLIYGGRQINLRVSDTLSALGALAENNHITTKMRDALTEAYIFLRHTEHRLQMQEDFQTHSLPHTDEDLKNFSLFTGFKTSEDFLSALEKRTSTVQSAYKKLFSESEQLSKTGNLVFTGIEDDLETLETIRKMGFQEPEKVTAAIRGWHHGRYRAVRTERARQILTELTPKLLEILGKTAHPDNAFLHFDLFLSHLPAGIQIFSMFTHKPELMKLVAEIMGTAPSMADYFSTHTEVLESVLSKDYFGKLPSLEDLTLELHNQHLQTKNYEDILNVTRRFAREKKFHAGIHTLKALGKTASIQQYLSDIAEVCIKTILPHTIKDFETLHGHFKTGELSLIAMGSFAAQQLSGDSDLDLIAVYQVDKDEKQSDGEKPLYPNVYYIRLMQRILTALTAPTAEGRLYNIDMRLRPSGDDGPLAISLEGFLTYQKEKAWAWEHMSLIRSRILIASSGLKTKLTKEIKSIIQQKRDPKKLRTDILDMRNKLEKQFPAKTQWNIKHQHGGIIDILFIAQYLTLRHAHTHKSLYHPRVISNLQRLEKNNILDKNDNEKLQKTYLLTQNIQNFLKLTSSMPFDPETAPQALKEALVKNVLKGQKDKNFQKLENELTQSMKESYKIYRQVFALK